MKGYSCGHDILGNLVDLKTEDCELDTKQEYKYIELANIAGNCEITGCMIEESQSLPTRARRKVLAGDVIVSSIPKGFHNLFFIDPYGYTQYSQENLRQLLRQKNSEYLIFIPTNHIYRFKEAEDNPASKFVSDTGVERLASETIDSFANELTEKLKEKANAEFAYNYKLKDKSVPQQRILFIFHHTTCTGGGEIFAGKNKVKEELERQSTIQMELFDAEEPEMELALRKIISPGCNRPGVI